MAIEVNNMKKMITILLALLLPLCASAETLREQVNAPEHATGRWTSNTGHTVITMDGACPCTRPAAD